MPTLSLTPKRLDQNSFHPFGDVIDTIIKKHFTINDGNTERYHDLANIDVLAQNGRPLVSIFRGQPVKLPFRVTKMERHPLSSQAFIPCSPNPFLVLVASTSDAPSPADLQLFLASNQQGVNYNRGTWHHYLLPLEQTSDFIVIDRGSDNFDDNCDEVIFAQDEEILITTPYPTGA